MIHRISKTKYKIYGFDIESHNDPISIERKETSIWLGCILDENSKMEDESCYFYTMDSVIDWFEKSVNPKRKNKNENRQCKNTCIYIYNASFEWSFILPVLIKRGFKAVASIGEDDEYCYSTVSTKSVSSIWTVQIKFGKKSGKFLIRDLAKIFGGGLGTVAAAFGLETQKGEIDYRLNRLHYRPTGEDVTQEEKEYCFKDVRIIIDILLEIIRKEDKEFFNVSSMASYSMKKLLKRGYPRALKPYTEYRKDYPVLDQEETEFLRHTVSGGICYCNYRYQFKNIECPVMHVDYHQHYPSQMYYNLFPYGKGQYEKGQPHRFGFVQNACHIRISYSGVLLHSVVQLIGLDMVSNYELWVWDFEIETMKKCYLNLEIEYIDFYSYKCKFLPFRKYVADNYKKRLQAKAENNTFYILYYKLLNNSCYGKFLEKPHNSFFLNYIREDGVIDSIVEEKPLEDFKNNAKYTYLPLSTIPARARCKLIEDALKIGYKNVLYFDTDSIFFIKNDETVKIWNDESLFDKTDFLGGIALEDEPKRSQFDAAKRYKLVVDAINKETGKHYDKTIIKTGGFNFKDAVPFDEINLINSSWDVKRAFRCKGGTIIDVQKKTLSVQDKYLSIYESNKDLTISNEYDIL